MEIVAVAMRDVAAFGVDRFYVRHGPEEVHLYDVFKDGRVQRLSEEALPERAVSAAIEKFNASYRVLPPVTVSTINDLPKHLDAFEFVDETTVRPRSQHP